MKQIKIFYKGYLVIFKNSYGTLPKRQNILKKDASIDINEPEDKQCFETFQQVNLYYSIQI